MLWKGKRLLYCILGLLVLGVIVFLVARSHSVLPMVNGEALDQKTIRVNKELFQYTEDDRLQQKGEYEIRVKTWAKEIKIYAPTMTRRYNEWRLCTPGGDPTEGMRGKSFRPWYVLPDFSPKDGGSRKHVDVWRIPRTDSEQIFELWRLDFAQDEMKRQATKEPGFRIRIIIENPY
ncbi:MAG: hypothetical protein Q4Q17_00015 [Tissierellia bacterium]|nr:hypothetical protein [Tissierellia bacterium]